MLPGFRSKLTGLFMHTGVDFAGPVMYCVSKKTIEKSRVAIFTCSTTRVAQLPLCKDLTADETKSAMKEFATRRGTPRFVISNNGKISVTNMKWLITARKSKEVMSFLTNQRISWNLNLSRTP